MHPPLCIDVLPRHVNIEGFSLTVKMLSQEQGNLSNNITNDFLKVKWTDFLLLATHLYSFGENKDFPYSIHTVDLLKIL